MPTPHPACGHLLPIEGRRNVFALFSFVFVCTSANAHPGHSLFDHGAAHFLSSPFHLLTFTVLALTFGVAARLTRSRRLRRCLHAGTVLSIVAAAAWFFSR
jgi:uncharacterized membrane protein